ncbi:IclR family transcriptional regulator [Leucobacter allii]|uniref:IclR family transcriptional regulator n=1 Tax=Leucobacter allii TaxID=2932247 RepID=A0ABY4FJ73_9MICO|nr:IclR family transcriptional regulator [Leucobacter allii]UOQ56751.1 IclR family transcriptional regulator [Leucobacter allii]
MDGSIPGAQVVGRVAAVLRAVSAEMPAGLGTTAVAAAAGLTRPTAHRLLAALAGEGFVDRDRRTGHWMLGPELFVFGTIAAERYDVTELAREHVDALAAATGESAFFSVRRGGETVCLLRADGSFPIRSFVLYEGKRFPLGVASAGLAILAYLPPEAVDRYLAAAALAGEFGEAHAEAGIRRRIAETRRTGYAVNPGLVVEGSWGMGAAVFNSAGQPVWALSLTGIAARFAPERRAELGELLLEHAHRLGRRLGP